MPKKTKKKGTEVKRYFKYISRNLTMGNLSNLLLCFLTLFVMYTAFQYVTGAIHLFRVIVYLFSAELMYRLLKVIYSLDKEND